MTADIESLVLEHLRHIRSRVDQIGDDVTDLKHRMTSLEGAMSLVKRELAYGDEISISMAQRRGAALPGSGL